MSEQPETTGIDPFIGQTVAGRYVVTDCIGRGGMGAVYRARQHPLGRDVALKVIRADLAHQPDIVRRFEREARAIARLADPHIVVVHDFGVSDGVLFLALELLNGVPLGVRLRDAGALPLRVALLIARDILVGLDVAHAAGVVHRDLKPDNIMLVRADGRDDYARILDFGIARIVGGPDGTVTSSQVVLGTPGYVAPEVIMGGMSDDPRTDLYAVGIMLFEMLAGRAPFVATTPSAILVAQASTDAPSLDRVVDNVPAPVTALVRRLTARFADERPATAREAITLIDQLLSGLPDTGAAATAAGRSSRAAPPSQTLVLGSSSAPIVDDGDFARPTPQTASLSLLAGSVATSSTPPSQPSPSPSPSPAVAPIATTGPTGPTGPITHPGRPLPRFALAAAAAGVAVAIALAVVATRTPAEPPMPVAVAAPLQAAPDLTAPTPPAPTTPAPTTIAPTALVAPVVTPALEPVPAIAAAPLSPGVKKAAVAKPLVKVPPTTTTAPTATTATAVATSAASPPTAPAGPPPLTSALVKQAFQQSVGKASACTNTNIKLASSGPGLFIDHCPSYKTLDGARQVALTVAPDGSVLKARFTDAPTNSHRLGACVLESLLAWKLLPFAGTEPVEILQRVTFEPCIPINGKCVF